MTAEERKKLATSYLGAISDVTPAGATPLDVIDATVFVLAAMIARISQAGSEEAIARQICERVVAVATGRVVQ